MSIAFFIVPITLPSFNLFCSRNEAKYKISEQDLFFKRTFKKNCVCLSVCWALNLSRPIPFMSVAYTSDT